MTLLLALAIAAAPFQSPQPDLSLLRRGIDSMAISLVRGSEPVLVGELWDDLADTSAGGAPALRRHYRTRNEIFGPHLGLTVVTVPAMALLYSHTATRAGGDSIALSRDSITGWRQASPEEGRRRVARLADPAHVDGSLVDVMLRAAPLATGYRTEFPAYIGSLDSVVIISARVTGSQTIRQRDVRLVDTWVVEMDYAGLACVLWIDQQTRALVRQTIRLTPDVHMLMQR